MRIRAFIAVLAMPVSLVAQTTTYDLVIAGTTDVHGRIRGWNYETNRPDSVRGLTRAATIVDSLRRDAPGRVVLLDAGDLLQGNSLLYVAARVSPAGSLHPMMAAMNAMQYDASAVGNHEFNYGVPNLMRTIGQAKFPFLATNARTVNGVHAFKSWTMVRRGDVKVGVIGATTPGSMIWDRDNLKGRLVINDIITEVRNVMKEVRSAGADVVVVTMHSGLDGASNYDTVTTKVSSENVAAELARKVPGIDLILFGHSHQEVADTVINGVLLMQPRNWATSVAVAHLRMERHGARWQVASKSSSVIQSQGHAENAAVLAATQPMHDRTIAWVTRPIGHTTVAWRGDSARVLDTPLIDFINEVERKVTKADLASTAAFSLDASLDSGAITPARMQAIYPYDNTLRSIRISGKQLREYLEQSARYFVTSAAGGLSVDPKIPGFSYDIVSGADYTIDVSKPAGSRITRLVYRGRNVTDADSFTMAVNNYRQTGGGGYTMLMGAPVIYTSQLEIRQMLIDEVQQKGTLSPQDYFTRNWHIEPASAVNSLYGAMRRSYREDAHAPGTSAARVSPTTRLRILGTNDVHGALEPRPDANGRLRGGAAYLAAAMHKAMAECVSPACESIVLDGGDEFQGTPASNLAFGRPMVSVFNTIGLAAGALGNHEFDWGQDTLRARMREAKYAILGANVRYADGRDVPWIRDDTIVTRGALKIGVIGLSTVSTPTTTKAANVADLRFLPPAPIVDSLTRRLRARGADYVIVIAHSGANCDRDGATNCNGEIVTLANTIREHVDAIVAGHTHTLIDATVNGIPVVEARSSGTALDIIDLEAGRSTHHVVDVLPDSLTADPVVAQIVRDAVAKVANLVDRPIANVAAEMPKEGNQYALGNFIADAQRAAGKSDVAVMNNGGIRAPMRKGQATYGSLFEIQPFGNVLYRVTVTGKTLRSYLEKIVARRPNAHVSGVIIVYDSTKAGSARMQSAKFGDGREIRDDQQYTITFTDFLATGGDGLGITQDALKVEPLSIVDLDALIDYLKARPQPVTAPREKRIINSAATP